MIVVDSNRDERETPIHNIYFPYSENVEAFNIYDMQITKQAIATEKYPFIYSKTIGEQNRHTKKRKRNKNTPG